MEIVQQIAVSAFVITIMLSVGLDLTLERIRAVFTSPVLLGGALVFNYGVMMVVSKFMHTTIAAA